MRKVAESIQATKQQESEIGKTPRQVGDTRSRQQKINDLRGERAVYLAQQESLRNQWKYFQEKLADLDVKSPIRGQVISWKIDELLANRPVEQGQMLMQIADPTGPWQIELQMPEDRMGYIRQAQQDRYEHLRNRLREVVRERLEAAAGPPPAESPAQPHQEPAVTEPPAEGVAAEEPPADQVAQEPPVVEITDEQVEAEVSQVPNEQLSAKLRELLGGGLLENIRAGLASIVDEWFADMPEDPIGKELESIAQASSYAEARTRLQQATDRIPEVEQPELRSRLRELLDDGLDDRLDLTYIMATDPNTKLHGKINEIHLNAEVHGEEGNTVLIKVEIDKQRLPHLRRGVTVTANVYCGRAPIGYVWFHDLIAFVQSRILFKYF